jgi:hypothetical protein
MFRVYNCKYLHKGDNKDENDDDDDNNVLFSKLNKHEFISSSSPSKCLGKRGHRNSEQLEHIEKHV